VADGPLTAIANLRGRTDNNGYLIVTIVGAGSGGTSSVDKATFTVGTSAGTLAMGVVAPVDTVVAGTIAGLAMDTARNLKVNVVAGGAGGGAVTIADGADVAEGTTTDVAVTGDNSGTEMAKLRGANKITADVWDSVNHWLKVNLQNTTVAVTQSGGWTATVSQGTAANLNAAVVGTGTAGAAAGGILTVQGVASMTKLLVTPDLPALASTSTKQSDGTQKTQIVDGTGNVVGSTANALDVNIKSGAGSGGTALADEAAFTQGTTQITPIGGLFKSAYTALTTGQAGVLRMTSGGGGYVNLDQVQGTNIDVNSGSKSAGTIRVVLATDQPALTNKLLVTPDANSSVNLAQVAGGTTATGHGTAAGTIRVELPTDGTGVVAAVTAITNALPAGSNLMGKVGIDQTTLGTTNAVTPVPSTIGGWTYFLKNGLSNTNAQVKSGQGTLGGWYIYNPNSSVAYVQIFDTATGSITVGTTVPKLSIGIPATSAANLELTLGIQFGTAICVAATTAATNATAPSTAVDCNFWFK
jgi:hypothetical protein